MLRNARTLQHLWTRALRHERACGQQPSLSVAPAPREHAAADRVTGDHVEGAAVLLGDRIGIEHLARRMWPGISGSSPARRGQDREVMPSRRTQGRGAAARWLAGHQTAEAPGSRPSGRRSPAARIRAPPAGARRSASVQSARAAVPSSNAPACTAAFGPCARRSRTGITIGRERRPRRSGGWRLIERAPPLIELEQRGAGLQAERPGRRQVVETHGFGRRRARTAGARDPG